MIKNNLLYPIIVGCAIVLFGFLLDASSLLNNQPEVNVKVEPKSNSETDVTIEIKTVDGTSTKFIPSNPKVVKDESLNIMYAVHDPLYYSKQKLHSTMFELARHNYSTDESHKLSNVDKSLHNALRLKTVTWIYPRIDIVTMNYNNSTISENIQDLILEFNKKEKYDVKMDLNDFADLTLIINECNQYREIQCVFVNHMKFLKNHEYFFLINYQTIQNPPSVDLTIKPEIKYMLNSVEILN